MKALKEIAAENNIVLKLEEASTSTEVWKSAINHKDNKKILKSCSNQIYDICREHQMLVRLS